MIVYLLYKKWTTDQQSNIQELKHNLWSSTQQAIKNKGQVSHNVENKTLIGKSNPVYNNQNDLHELLAMKNKAIPVIGNLVQNTTEDEVC